MWVLFGLVGETDESALVSLVNQEKDESALINLKESAAPRSASPQTGKRGGVRSF